MRSTVATTVGGLVERACVTYLVSGKGIHGEPAPRARRVGKRAYLFQGKGSGATHRGVDPRLHRRRKRVLCFRPRGRFQLIEHFIGTPKPTAGVQTNRSRFERHLYHLREICDRRGQPQSETRHVPRTGVWRTSHRVTVRVRDEPRIEVLLLGNARPAAGAVGGRGWRNRQRVRLREKNSSKSFVSCPTVLTGGFSAAENRRATDGEERRLLHSVRVVHRRRGTYRSLPSVSNTSGINGWYGDLLAAPLGTGRRARSEDKPLPRE
jgi:hypothetical protein